MSDKPFLTVDEQIELLKSRGLSFVDEQSAKLFLLENNYYSVVNGYKDVFIGRRATNAAGDDRYPPGFPFEAFVLLFQFDSSLRVETMAALLEVENMLKNATVYAFCESHRETEAYLDPASYCLKSEYPQTDKYTENLIKLLSTLQRTKTSGKDYVRHYTRRHNELPFWVAAKCLTFGNMSSFYDLQTQSVQSKTCANVCRITGKRYISQKQLAKVYRILPTFRNTCAHNERFYCSRAGARKELKFRDMLELLDVVFTSEQSRRYAQIVLELLEGLEPIKPFDPYKRILDGMGIAEDDLVKRANPE